RDRCFWRRPMKNIKALLAPLPLLAALAACTQTTIIEHHVGASADPDGGDVTGDGTDGDGGVTTGDAGTKDSGTKKDAGQSQAAPREPIPEVTYNGGNILDAVSIVTVTFDGDTLRSTVESFGSEIATTGWWDAVTNGYCDGRGKCIGHGT